jgi:hypothetical protein
MGTRQVHKRNVQRRFSVNLPSLGMPRFAIDAPMHPALRGNILPHVMRSLVLILLLIFGLAPGAEARSQRRASQPRPPSRQAKRDKRKRNRKPPIYDQNGRRMN